MKIDYTKLEEKFWYEDENGNKVGEEDPNACIYRRCFPLELHEMIYEYCYHPQNSFIKYLCKKSKKFYKWISKGKDKTFREIVGTTTSFGSKLSQECIVAMVNSGDFTLEQAIWVYANSCERCMNALIFKYLNGADGYEEHSEEWNNCNTHCDFCKCE